MSGEIFPSFPDTSRIWIFPLVNSLSDAEEDVLREKLDSFIATWKAHGEPVHGAVRIVYHRFVIIAADPLITLVSGCSIDSLYRSVAAALDGLNVPYLDSASVIYRDDKNILNTTRDRFKELGLTGKVTTQTIVFDNSLTSLKELRAGKWELPCSRSWHNKLISSMHPQPNS